MLEAQADANEIRQLIYLYSQRRKVRNVAWEFLTTNYDSIVARLPSSRGVDAGTSLMFAGRGFCDAEGRAKVESFFGERAKKLQGGPRELAQTLESIDQCIARRAALEQPLAEFLKQY
jgi:cytosol alanyl aminopeptidase